MNFYKSAAIATCSVLFSGAAHSASIVNGSFEDPITNSNFTTFTAGSTGITGWTVGSGSIDLVDNLWIAQQGDNAIDLDGSSVGSIYQDIVGLIIGTAYGVTFHMSGNESGNPTIKTMDVSAGGTTTGYSFDDSSGGAAAGVWEQNLFTFTAGSTTERLTFQSTTGGTAFGPAIDNISIAAVSAVPLPAGGALLLSGLIGFGALRRKRSS